MRLPAGKGAGRRTRDVQERLTRLRGLEIQDQSTGQSPSSVRRAFHAPDREHRSYHQACLRYAFSHESPLDLFDLNLFAGVFAFIALPPLFS